MIVGPAQPAEYPLALQRLFAHLPVEDNRQRAIAALSLLESRSDSVSQLLVARRRNVLVGAALMQVLVGATGVIWPPGGDDVEIEDALARAALAWLVAHGAKLVQAILSTNEAFIAQPLLRNGFHRPTRLCYLSHDLQAGALPAVQFEPFGDANRLEFETTLWHSYEQTLDFPEVSGRRSLDDVLRGHRSNDADAIRWWLLRDRGQPAGVLLLEELDRGKAMDLVYLGVIPDARGRGLGRELARKAIVEAKGRGANELTLCVDARNAPARRIYNEMGFVEFDRREVFLALPPLEQ